jgi:hypothetical protein
MKHKTRLWAYLVLAGLIIVLVAGCATLDNLLGVNDPSGAQSPLVTTVQGTGALFGPVGTAIATLLTTLSGSYVLIRRATKTGSEDHNTNVEAICSLQKEIESLKKGS